MPEKEGFDNDAYINSVTIPKGNSVESHLSEIIDQNIFSGRFLLSFARIQFERADRGEEPHAVYFAGPERRVRASPKYPVAIRPIGQEVQLVYEGVFSGSESGPDWVVMENPQIQIEKDPPPMY